MTVTPSAEPAPGAGGTAAASQAGTPPETGREPGDQPAEMDAAKLAEDLKNTRAQQAAMQERIEKAERAAEEARVEAERLRAAGVQPPPTTTAPNDPLLQDIADLQAQFQANPNDAATRYALREAIRQAEWRAAEQQKQAQIDKFRHMPEAVGKRAWELWTGGLAATPEIARAAAEREAKDKDETDKLRKELEELRKDREAREAPRVALGGSPPLSPTPAATPEGRIRMTQAQWSALDSMPLPRQRELLRAYNDGRIDWAD